uniref:Transposase (putative) gypsy type domain-containing protein n=1 Tax=Tanacetum cinerariifolium TaxID=118510 RepID=A0A6L2MQ80_TANCI|nr:hypothetical protein [Tanacetum cinerariifolium]
MFELSNDAIGIYYQMFDFSRVRVPFSSFLLALIKHYRVYFSQLGPLGLNKVITFEVLCRSLQIELMMTFFKVFQTLYKQSDWISFAKRHAPSLVCIDDNRSCMKHWKSGFFLIDQRAILDSIVWRHPTVAIDDPRLAAGSFKMADVRRLRAHIIKLKDMHEGLWAFMILSAFLSGPVLRSRRSPILIGSYRGYPSSKILAKVKASQKRKASTSGATSSHVAKHTRSTMAQSSGSTTRPSLFLENSNDESDDDGDACIEILLITPLCSVVMILSLGNQGGNFAAPAAEDSRVKGIMADDAAVPFVGVRRSRPSFRHAPSFRDVFRDAIYMNFFSFLPVLIMPLILKVSGLNDKLSSFDASFVKSKAKGKERKKKIKSLTKSLDNLHVEVAHLFTNLNRATVLEAEKDEEILRLKAAPPKVQGELLSLAASAGFERGLSMHQTKDEFAAVLKKMAHLCLVHRESTVTHASKSLELPTNVSPTSSAIDLGKNKEWVNVMVEVPDPKNADCVVNAISGRSERVSSGPSNVVVALYVGKKGDGSLPSSAISEEAVDNPSEVSPGYAVLVFMSSWLLVKCRLGYAISS